MKIFIFEITPVEAQSWSSPRKLSPNILGSNDVQAPATYTYNVKWAKKWVIISLGRGSFWIWANDMKSFL